MARFKHTDNSQTQIMIINLSEQLLPGTFEWTIDFLINKTDMSIFEQNYHNDKNGAAAYSPRILLKAIFYCYSRGIISSRKIEKACNDNIIVKALAEDSKPDHDTIATFISTNSEAVTDLFTQVLLQCGELGLITGEMYALDGCKLPSNASKEWSGKISGLKKKRDKLKIHISKMLLQHQDLDKDEKARKKQEPFRKTMGDDRERRERSIERLENKLHRLNRFLEYAKPKIGVSGEEVQTNVTDPQSAKIKSPHGYIQGYNGITIADSGNQIVISAEVIGSGAESGCFPEMLNILEENMKKVTGKEEPLKKAILEADTGYFSEDNLQKAAEKKIEVLIPDPQFRQRDPYFAEKKEEKVKKTNKTFTQDDFKYDEKNDSYICPSGNVLEYKDNVELRNNTGKKYQAKIKDCTNCQLSDKCIKKRTSKKSVRTIYIADKKYEDNLSEKMRKKIDDPAYRELYSRRMQIVEPVFSNITYCKGMNRFTLRGKKKVNIQWKLFNIVHNMWKCMKPLAEKFGT